MTCSVGRPEEERLLAGKVHGGPNVTQVVETAKHPRISTALDQHPDSWAGATSAKEITRIQASPKEKGLQPSSPSD